MKLSNLYAADLAAFILSIGCSASGYQLAAVPPAIAGLSLSGYLIAKVPKKDEQKLLDSARIGELETKLNELTNLTSWQQELLESTEAKKVEELAALRSQYEKLLSDIKATHLISLRAKDEELSQLNENHSHKLLEATQALEERITQLESELSSTYQWRENVAKKDAELRKLNEELALAEKSLRLEEKRIRLDIRDERGVTKEALQNAQLEIQAQNVLIQRLQSEITSLKNQNEQLFNELYSEKSPEVEDLIKEIQSALNQHGIATEFLSKANSENVEVIRLKPVSYFEPTKLDLVAKMLPGFLDIPEPKIEAKKGQIQIRIDRRDELDRIKDAPENWLEKLYQDAAKDGKNLAILGARGKGKTELAKNYCGLVISGEPDSEIIYIQPKVDDYASFKILGKTFEPDYVGFEPITSDSGLTIPSAYDGILYLKQLYDERNKANQKAFANGEPSPKFNRVFFLIDELQLLVSREKEFIDADTLKTEKLRASQTFCGKIVRDAVSVGRSLGITALALGQLPNVSVYGWNKNDLYQYITIFMSANIPEAANSYAPTKEEKNRISGELELWRKRASVDGSKDYYCYVRPMDKSGYLALLPAPGKYLAG
ncbi:MAG TPA: hypothetical protein VK211_12670 [Kamptonema sp.]|nr:hypothetical protein [Kamptonema sp.]